MRIVLDLQAAQASNRQRGIGRYSLALARALAELRGERELLIALNGGLSETIAPLRATFDGLIPQQDIRIWHGSKEKAAPTRGWRRRADELVREAFLVRLKPDIMHVASLFEGFEDNAVTSVATLAKTLTTSATLYDLIPLVHQSIYLAHPTLNAWYRDKLDHLKRTDLLLAISEHSRREAIDHIELSPDRVVNIAGAADARFQPRRLSPDETSRLHARYGITRSFIMYTGGIDHRKNIDGLLKAYAVLPEALRSAHQLLIVCHASADAQQTLRHLASNLRLPDGDVVLAGFVPDDDLVALYNLCAAFVFPSWHEGFGLPALEAMACGAPVVASNLTSLPEVVGRVDALFDPHDPRAIAGKLAQVLQDESFCNALRAHGPAQAARFSWAESARRALDAFEHVHDRRKPSQCYVSGRALPKLALVAPLPPLRTGIAAYSAELVPALAAHYDIDVIVDQQEVSDGDLKAHCGIRTVDWFEANADRYDRILYQFGNSHFHKHMFGLLERHPGVVALHDFYLSSALFHMELHDDAPACWSRALYASHGYGALAARFASNSAADIIKDYPANYHVVQHALGVLVHSQFSLDLARQWYEPDRCADWTVIPQLHAPHAAMPRVEARARLGIGADDFVVCSFGIIADTKLNHRLLDAWLASQLGAHAAARLVFVGDHYGSEYGQALQRTIARSGAAARVKIVGFCSDESYGLWLSAADAAVQLRTSSRGETSRAVLDCMNAGLPTVANAHGTMRDFPMNVLLPDTFTDEELAAALEQLWRDTGRRHEIGERARQHLSVHHEPKRVAARCAAAIERYYLDTAAGRRKLLSSLAALAPSGGDNIRWSELAQSVAQSLRPATPTRQLLLDVTGLVEASAGPRDIFADAIGELVVQLLTTFSSQLRVEPVVIGGSTGMTYARSLACRLLGLPEHFLRDEPAEYRQGDVYLNPFGAPTLAAAPFRRAFRATGGRLFQVVHDGQLDIADVRRRADILDADGAVCTSRQAACRLLGSLRDAEPEHHSRFSIGFMPHQSRESAAPGSRLLHWQDMLFDNAHPYWVCHWRPNPSRGTVLELPEASHAA